jgi:hypothetical protein
MPYSLKIGAEAETGRSSNGASDKNQNPMRTGGDSGKGPTGGLSTALVIGIVAVVCVIAFAGWRLLSSGGEPERAKLRTFPLGANMNGSAGEIWTCWSFLRSRRR